MKVIKTVIYPSIIAYALLISAASCTKDTLLFPEQIEAEDQIGSDEKGPVKQNSFAVILDDDEKVKFDLSNVDKERVKALYFSYNAAGEKVDTEITNFDELYIINNLPIRTAANIEVWAVGHNDLLSQKYTYTVTPLPYPATIVSENLEIANGVNTGTITISNRSRAAATLYYKVDNAQGFQSQELPSPTPELDIELGTLAAGVHTLTYYVTDANGGQSKEFMKNFTAYRIAEINKSEITAEVSSIENNEGAANGKGSSLLDGDINTYWHSDWSSSNPSYPHWIVLDLGKERLFTGLEMIRRHNNTTGGFKTFSIQYSDDNVTWNTLESNLTFNSADSPAAFQRYITSMVNTRYVRIYITEPMNSNNSTHLAEINVFEAL